MAIAEIVERVAGVRFQDFVTANVIKRLPFRSTTYNTTEAELSGHLGEGFSMVKRNVSSGGQGWRKSVYNATRLFIPAIEDITAGPGGVMMSAADAVSGNGPSIYNRFYLAYLTCSAEDRLCGYKLCC